MQVTSVGAPSDASGEAASASRGRALPMQAPMQAPAGQSVLDRAAASMNRFRDSVRSIAEGAAARLSDPVRPSDARVDAAQATVPAIQARPVVLQEPRVADDIAQTPITPIVRPVAPTAPAPTASKSLSPLERLRARAAVAQEGDDLGGGLGDEAQRERDEDEIDIALGRPAAPQAVATKALEGVVSDIRQYGDWSLAYITTRDMQVQRLSGTSVSSMKEGLRYRVEGVLRLHAKHGESLEVSAVVPLVDADLPALQRYLTKHFDGVGPKKAEAYLRALQAADPLMLEELSRVLIHEPWLLDVHAVLAAQPRIRAQPGLLMDEAKEGHAHPAGSNDDGDDERTTGEADRAQLARVKQAQRKVAVESLTRAFNISFGAGSATFKEPQAKALAEYFWVKFGPDPDLLDKSIRSLREDPYAPVLSAPGFGFVTADSIGKRMGIAPDDARRLCVAGMWVVQQVCARKGHVYLMSKDFVAEIRRVMPGVPPQNVINACAAKNTLVIEPAGGRIYVPKLWAAERRVADKIAERLRPCDPLTSRGYADVVNFLKTQAHRINERFAKDGLDEGQIHAVAAILTAPTSLHVVTGGPGTGKTTIMECAVWMLRHRKNFQFAAPTGKAARVLANRLSALNVSASTICSMLRGTDEAGYEVNAEKPLETDVLVVDESTMVGIESADAIFQATQAHTHIIFLGDPGLVDDKGAPDKAGQLPSISPGRFMHDLQTIPEVQNLHLTKVFRNGGGILDVVREVADGKLDVKDRVSVKFDPLPTPQQALQTVIARYLEVSRRDGMANTVLVMPRRAGDVSTPGWNVTWSNAVLRDILNRDGIKMPGTVYRLGDRIIVRQNIQAQVPTVSDLDGKSTTLDAARLAKVSGIDDPQPMMTYQEHDPESAKQVRLVNGDTGFILGWRMDSDNPRMGQPRWVELLLDDSRRVWLPGEEIGILDHAYALTVHAVQGSEYSNVLFCATDGGENFMNANMLLTALSRAKSHLHVWGDEKVLKRVAATRLPDRNSDVPQKVAAYNSAQKPDDENDDKSGGQSDEQAEDQSRDTERYSIGAYSD